MAYGTATLLDLSKLSSDVPVNVIQTIVDAQPLFDQMRFVPCNNGTTNKTLIVTDYPEGQTRAYNEGVSPEKAGGIQVIDSTCMVSSYSQIDAKILALNGNSAEWRANQEKAFQIGLAHKMAERVFNGSIKKDPKSFDGLCVRYNKVDNETVFDMGGTSGASDGLVDIWLVNWDTAAVHGIYPQGGVAGFTRIDRGEVDCYDANGKRFRGVVTDFSWDCGIAVENRRHVIRLANIDIAAVKADASSGLKLVDALIKGVEAFPVSPGSGCAIYMNSVLRTLLRQQIGNKANVQLGWEEVAGRKVVTWDGIPVHKLPTSILKSYTTPVA